MFPHIARRNTQEYLLVNQKKRKFPQKYTTIKEFPRYPQE